jgi:hypothetical protein
MATTPFILERGGFTQILGSASSLAFAAPLSNGSRDAAALTDATRIGWFWDRTASSEKAGLVVQGTEVAHLGVYGIRTIAGSETVPSLSFIADPDTGVYNAGTNRLGLITAGVERLRVYEAGGVALRGLAGFGADPGSGNMQAITYRGNSGGLTEATYTVAGDLDTGIWFPSSGSVAITNDGTLGFSVTTTAVTAYRQLLTQASTTAAASLRAPHGTAPTSPVNGDIWTTTAGFFVQVNGATVGPISSTILFSQTQTVTVTGTTPGTLLGTGIGSVTIPANYFVAGKKIRIAATLETARPANSFIGTFTLTFGSWTATIASSSTNGTRPVVLVADFTVKTTGVTGTLAGHLTCIIGPGGGGAATNTNVYSSTVTFDTTAATTLTLVGSTNQANATTTCYALTIESLFF